MKSLRDKIVEIIWAATENYEMGAQPSCGSVADAIIECINNHNKENSDMDIKTKASNFMISQRWFTNILVKLLCRQMKFGHGNDHVLYQELMTWRHFEKV